MTLWIATGTVVAFYVYVAIRAFAVRPPGRTRPASERRLVQTDDVNETGGPYLELADATPARAATP